MFGGQAVDMECVEPSARRRRVEAASDTQTQAFPVATAGSGDLEMEVPFHVEDVDMAFPVVNSVQSHQPAQINRNEEVDDPKENEHNRRGFRLLLGHPPVVFALPGSHDFTKKVLTHLSWHPGGCRFKLFNNGEISAKVEQSVTSLDVFIVYARNEKHEVNFTLMQLLMFLDALRGESPHRITVIFPCLEYSRQDRRIVAGESIPPKLFLRCMRTAGADRFLTMDLHNQAEAAFSPAGAVLDELSSNKYLAHFIRCNMSGFDTDEILVCATSGGGLQFTRRMANELRTGFIMADRFRPKAGGVGQIRIISDMCREDVKAIIIVDDMFDTCGALAEVCGALNDFAPNAKLYGIAIHGYFSGEAHLQIKKLVETCKLEWLAVTNSIAQDSVLQRLGSIGLHNCLKVVDISRLIAGAIVRVHLGVSVNLPTFKNLEPTTHDPILQMAPSVPQVQYSHIFGDPNEAVTRTLQLQKHPSIRH